jgi:hypothetical protein
LRAFAVAVGDVDVVHFEVCALDLDGAACVEASGIC